MFRRATLSFVLIGFSTLAFASPFQSVVVDGEYAFGPQVSQEEACEQAEVRAKEGAIRKVFGETYFGEQSMDCSDRWFQGCDYARMSVTHLNGHLVSFTDRSERVFDKDGLRVCRVMGKARLDTSQKSDPSMFFEVSLDRAVYRDGDELKAKVHFSNPSYLAIFSQADLKGAKVERLFPNRHVRDARIGGKVLIPEESARYRFRVESAQGQGGIKTAGGSHRGVPYRIEYLYVIRTSRAVDWLSSYSPEELQKHLALIPPRDRFVRVIPYRVIQ
jgi:hypothetical protein